MGDVTVGPNHAAAISLDKELYTWGFDSSGRLGHQLTKKQLKHETEVFYEEPQLSRSMRAILQVNRDTEKQHEEKNVAGEP